MRRFVLLLSLACCLIGSGQALAQSPLAQSPLAQSPLAQPPPAQSPLAQSPLAQSRLDEITGRGVLRVGLTGDYRPFSLRDASGAYAGLDVDMAQDLADSLGVKLEIVPTTWTGVM